ncbi:uncharacterized protein LOC117335471 [Pecten maximus]|uniref:uncharacterized protein LOC117335471 n=1 Tax=Pecten maximus TaxID=6579 RepID=UPI001458171B|nr:uncharacterized protein LOC117335471 [Pecten maximus]XP_033751376.1 uncharacterized protein LOC117335471 [Pecten maximus]
MTDEDDDLDLLDERTEALWDSKILSLIAQSSQKKVELEDSGPSSYDEDEEQSSTRSRLENDKPTHDSVDQENSETDNLLSSDQTEANTASTSNKRSKWSPSDLYNIGLGPKHDILTTCVSPSQSAQKQLSQSKQCTSNAVVPESLPPFVPKVIFLDEKDEELEDYVDSDSSGAEEIQSSPVKKSVPDCKLKRPYDKYEVSDDDLTSSSPIVCSSPSPDRPKIKARRKFNANSPIVISDISEDNASPQVNKDHKQTKIQNVSVTEPPVKVSRIKNEFTERDSSLCKNLQSRSIVQSEPTKGMKYTGPLPGKESKPSKKDIGSRQEKNQSSVDQSTANEEDINKVCEWFPDACRKWIKQKIESSVQRGNENYLDFLVDSMVDGNYPKSTQTDPASQPGNKEPDIVVALGNNKIKTHSQSDRREKETNSAPPIRLYGKKSNYVGGPKGKGKAAVPKKPVRNVLDEYQSSEDEKDICMITAESMDTVRDNEVSSSSLPCESCKMSRNTDMVVQCCDGHLICNSCVEKEVKEILSPDSQEAQIKCPSENCKSTVPESQAKKILPNLILELLEDKLHKQAVESITKMEDLVTCPNCSFPVVMDAGIKEFECPNCKNTSCRYCKRLWLMTSHEDCNQFTTFLQENQDSKDLEPPSYWHPMPEEGDKDYVIVNLETSSVEFRHIKTLFSHSMSAKHITAIRRIQNPRLWQKFCLARKHMVEDYGQNQLNEKQLFHGTSTKAFDAICREGLDWRMCGENGTAFGQGTYFAKRAAYSDRYSQVPPRLGRTLPLPLANSRTIPLPPASSSAQFAQAFNLPSSFNTPQSNNPFLQQQPATFNNFGYQQPQQQSLLNTTSQSFGPTRNNNGMVTFGQSSSSGQVSFAQGQFGPSSASGQVSFAQGQFGPSSASGQVSFAQGQFGPSSASGQSSFAQGQFGPSSASNSQAIFQGYNQDPTMTTPLVSSSTDKVVFTNVEDTISLSKKYMFVARTLVGRYCLGNTGIRKPPPDPDDPKRRPFNSCVDNVLTPSIFVIFDSAQCYPEYIVEYAN